MGWVLQRWQPVSYWMHRFFKGLKAGTKAQSSYDDALWQLLGQSSI